MTQYEVLNAAGEVVAVVLKFADGRCVVHYIQTVFDSIEALHKQLSTFSINPITSKA